MLVALDITEEVVEEAREAGAQLIVSHHPVIFHPAKRITDDEPTGRILLALTEAGIAAICAHTNLDLTVGGVNEALARKLGMTELAFFEENGTDALGPYGLGYVGRVEKQSFSDFAAFVRDALDAGGVRVVDAGREVNRVAVGGGACGDMVRQAAEAGCDTFVTSDVKYDQFLEAKALGINLIDAGHFPTENVVCPVLASWIREDHPELEVVISRRHRQVYSYV